MDRLSEQTQALQNRLDEPDTLWIALHRGTPGRDQAENELHYRGYKRQPIANFFHKLIDEYGNFESHYAIPDRVVFPANPYICSIRVTHFSVADQAGRVIAWGEVKYPLKKRYIRIPGGAIPSFPPGEITIDFT